MRKTLKRVINSSLPMTWKLKRRTVPSALSRDGVDWAQGILAIMQAPQKLANFGPVNGSGNDTHLGIAITSAPSARRDRVKGCIKNASRTLFALVVFGGLGNEVPEQRGDKRMGRGEEFSVGNGCRAGGMPDYSSGSNLHPAPPLQKLSPPLPPPGFQPKLTRRVRTPLDQGSGSRDKGSYPAML